MASNVIPFRAPAVNDNMADRTPPSPAAPGRLLRFPAPQDTPQMRFKRAYYEASVARAAEASHRARYLAWLALDRRPGQPITESPYISEKPFEEMRLAVFKLAITPATNRQELAYKKSLIGRMWLKAEGEFYDALRAGVEIDELRFAKKPKRKSA